VVAGTGDLLLIAELGILIKRCDYYCQTTVLAVTEGGTATETAAERGLRAFSSDDPGCGNRHTYCFIRRLPACGAGT
jgi:hypothetical protein